MILLSGWRFILIASLAAVLLAACQPAAPTVTATEVRLPSATLVPSFTATRTPTLTATPTPQPSLTASITPSITPTPEPAGCLQPPEDYTRVKVNGWTLNRRTLAMLEQAAHTYGGELEITGYAITQGSYHDNGAASFGTHLGGGAVDLSVMRKGTYQVLWEDIEPLIQALRTAGFAAWLRDLDELYPGSSIHIHAIAIGDQELSQAAVEQLTGPRGYFYGLTGIPYGDPAPDRHGGPVLCQWMLDQGYQVLGTPVP
jgi:hypothetical protein